MHRADERASRETAAARRPPLTDSAWFWMFLFCAAGLVALFAIGPRYGRRQSQLERQHQSREAIARRAAGEQGDLEQIYSTPDQTVIGLWALRFALAAIALVAAVALRRQRTCPSPPAEGPT